MARFYASIKGSRGEATRTGSKDSGVRGHIRGWNVGCATYMRPQTNHETGKVTDEDRGFIEITAGSNGGMRNHRIAEFHETPVGTTVILFGKNGETLATYNLNPDELY